MPAGTGTSAARLLAARGADPRRVALHLLNCEPADDPDRVSTLRLAAEAAARTGTPSAVAEYLRRALAESPGTPDRADILFELGLAEFALTDPAALGHVRDAVTATADDTTRATRSLLSADLHLIASQGSAAARQLDDVLASPEVTADDELTLRLRTKKRWLQLVDQTVVLAEHGRIAALPAPANRPDSLARRELLSCLFVEASGNASRAEAEALLRQLLAPPGITAFIGAESANALWVLNCLHALELHDELDALAETMRGEASGNGNVFAYASVGLVSARQLLRMRSSGVESLTPSEASVARLAAAGLSNVAIAQTLFVTQKTVESHLAAAYRKLGIRSRAELPALFC